MVIVFSTGWFPHDKASEAGKTFIEVMKKYPRDRTLSKVLLDNAIGATKEGYKALFAVEVKDGKLKEYLARLNQSLIYIAENIEGYKFEVEVLSSITEAMAVLGLESPV